MIKELITKNLFCDWCGSGRGIVRSYEFAYQYDTGADIEDCTVHIELCKHCQDKAYRMLREHKKPSQAHTIEKVQT